LDTFIPPTFKLSWSHSSLSTYETCPRQFYHQKIAKDTVETIHPNTTYGLLVHEAMEKLGKDGTPLPQEFSAHQVTADNVAALAKAATNVRYEHQMGVKKDGSPCGFFDPDVYGRAIADVLMVYEPTNNSLIWDFKLGKYRGKTNQAVINAYHVFAAEPEVELVHTVFDYMTAGVKDTNTFRRENIVRDFAPVQKLVTDLENSVVYENFPQRRNGLCKDWCSAVKCPLNGRYRGGF
jgi:hypothetical protein